MIHEQVLSHESGDQILLTFFIYKNQSKSWKLIKKSMKHSDMKWETKYPTKYRTFSDPILLQVQEFGNEKKNSNRKKN